MEDNDGHDNLNTENFDYDNFNGNCFYPFEIQKHETTCVSRLDCLTAEKFLSSENYLTNFDKISMPTEIYHTLLSIASLQFQYNTKALSFLVNTWPYQTFSLQAESKLDTNHFMKHRKMKLEATPERVSYYEVKEKIQLGLAVLHVFLESLRNRSETKIKILDLRGFPLDTIGINYLTCQGLLAHNEWQRNEILRTVNHAVEHRRISTHEASAFGDLHDFQNSFPEKSYAVIVDCFVNSEKSFKNLCKALTVSKFQTCPIKIFVDKVRVSYGYDVGTNLLLELINRNTLHGFGVDKLMAHHLNHVLPSLHSFSDMLTSVDFSGNLIDFSRDLYTTTLVVDFFKSVKNLNRLDLSFCKLTRQLKKLLSVLPSGLVYLNLNDCDLAETDLIYFSSCHHCDTLQELCLGNNNLSTSTSSLCCLLKKCRHSLKILHLQLCNFKNAQAERIFLHLSSLGFVEWINITKNCLLRQTLTNFGPLLKNHPSLRFLWLPYPAFDFHSPTPEDLMSEENQVAINLWRNVFENLIIDLFDASNISVKCAHVMNWNYFNSDNL